MSGQATRRFFSNPANLVLLALALAALGVHLLANALSAYGYFRDELYYVACSDHLASGYVDQPPFSIFVLALDRMVFGDSLFALHLPAAVAGGVTVFLTGLMARELGGGRFAQVLAAVAVIVSPIYLGFCCYFSMNSLDVLIWAASVFIMIKILKKNGQGTSTATYWILLGAVLGIGLLNKIDVLWLGAGIALGLLFTPYRQWFKTRWPWVAGGIAFLFFLPFIVWNVQHDLAHLEFIRNASGSKYSGLSPLTFILGQVVINNPVALPLWLAGVWFLFSKKQKQFRPLGIIYVVAFLTLLFNGHSKSEYLSPAYTMLFAGGGVAFERVLATGSRAWLRVAYCALLVISGCVFAPLAMPVLPVEDYIRYADALGQRPGSAEAKQLGRLPQFFADMFGWEEKTRAVAKVFNSLPAEDRAKCAIFASNYGRCAAIDFFGPTYGLPRSIGNHNNYWIWGPPQTPCDIVIILGGNPEEDRKSFEEVVVADTASCTYCMPYENHLLITVCRKLKSPLSEVWVRIKHYE